MFKRSAKFSVVLVILTTLVLLCLQFFETKFVLSEKVDIQSVNQPTIVATAPLPPSLVPGVLGGKPVYILYVTRSQDTVLVRCYPGYEPTITVRAMGSNPNAKTQREGVMTCRPSA
ncbi:hypothetical protein BV372_00285 [Nostoc sp. T09]|uniref:hypothetical protein n=1 Tax=Nostoc sp. T09 TaxID=1932621 RepID=UPI000A37FDF0|nr:hypothetical protein [Nostoc sp. T09]OUL37830.1 hypothetical protein BV372_00285 [Nostoc sp. T09]